MSKILGLIGSVMLTLSSASCSIIGTRGDVVRANPTDGVEIQAKQYTDTITTAHNIPQIKDETVKATAEAVKTPNDAVKTPTVATTEPAKKHDAIESVSSVKPSANAKKEKTEAAISNSAQLQGNSAQADLTQANKPQSNVAPTNKSNKHKIIGLLEGEWQIVQVGNKSINLEEDMPYINFSESNNKFYASNGCNILNGSFAFVGESSILFSNVLTSLKSCPDIDFEKSINHVLRDQNTVKLSIDNKGKETYITMETLSGSNKLILRRNNLDKISGAWMITEIAGQKVEVPDLNIFFNSDDMTVHGNTGCNYFNGEMYADHTIPNSISFSHMGVTMRLCPNAELERNMLVALEQTATYSLSGKHTLHLLDHRGSTVMILHREK